MNAPYIDMYGPIKLAAGRYFPLGLGYIAAVLIQNGFEVKLLDPEAQDLSSEDIKKICLEWSPSLVGISSATPNFSNAAALAKDIKSINKNITVAIGGIHASSLPDYVLKKSPEIDCVVIGEGEYAMLEIAKALRDGSCPFSDIKGLAYRKGGETIFTLPRPFVPDIDSLPEPARNMLDMKLFFPNVFNIRRRLSAGMITSRGCPFKCYFCASHITMGDKYRPHSAERVIDEMSRLVKDNKVEQILFMDDTFAFNKERVFRITESIIKNKIKADWHCFARVSDVNTEMLRLMERAGCSSIGFGVESGDDKILMGIKKGITLDQVKKAFNATKSTKMRVQAFFVFGNKNETKENIDKTISLSLELAPHLAFFNILTPYPGTRAFSDLGIKDLDTITNWEDFVAIGPRASLGVGGLSKEELLSAMNRANRAFYFRPGQLLKILFSIRSFYELSAYIKGGFALLLQMFAWNKSKTSPEDK